MSEVASANDAVLVKSLELWTLREVSVYTYNVSVGRYVVDVITTPGYAKRVAVTSIWHLLVQDADGPREDTGVERLGDSGGAEELGDGPGVEDGSKVWTIVVVVAMTWVEVKDCVINMVDITVDAGTRVVISDIWPDNVLVTVCPGRVKVDTLRLVTVLAGSWVVRVEVAPGSVKVERIVDAGSWETMVEVIAGCVMRMTLVLAGNCVVLKEREVSMHSFFVLWRLTIVVTCPGRLIVLVTIWGGNVVVEIMVTGGAMLMLVTTVGGRVRVEMDVTGGWTLMVVTVSRGRVEVEVIVEIMTCGGSCVVIVCVGPGIWVVVTTVDA
jgi:hypothetical protein